MDITPPLQAKIDALAKAIRRRSVVSFVYPGYDAIVVEPVALGIYKETGKHVLKCYKSFPLQLADKKENWLLCNVDDISNLKTTPLRSKNFRNGDKNVTAGISEIIEINPDYE